MASPALPPRKREILKGSEKDKKAENILLEFQICFTIRLD